MRVLVLEDDGRLMSMMCDNLRSDGCIVDFGQANERTLARAASYYDRVVLAGVSWLPQEAIDFYQRVRG
jgi:hypothetical protein